jgi:hypothetical protein
MEQMLRTYYDGRATMKQYQPQERLMRFQATQNELIALGWVVTHTLNLLERQAQKTPVQLDMIALLRSFQRRITHSPASTTRGGARPL